MAAALLVFVNEYEKATCSADVSHDWENQPRLFGREESKLLKACEDLKRINLPQVYFKGLSEEEIQQRKSKLVSRIFGIAKKYHLFIAYNASTPDRFLVTGHGNRLALIQC